MKNNKQLLFLAEPNDEHRRFVISEVLADMDDQTQHLLRETGAYDRIVGYAAEMWLRGTGKPLKRPFSALEIDQLAAATKTALETALR